MSQKNPRLGYHQLVSCGCRKPGEVQQFRSAVETAQQVGAGVFEFVLPPITNLKPEEIARALIDYNMIGAACMLYPGDGTLGDPLGDLKSGLSEALRTFENHITFLSKMRDAGANIEAITGPWAFRLGHDYEMPKSMKRTRMIDFCSEAAKRLESLTGVTACLEALRTVESPDTLDSTAELLRVVRTVDAPCVKAHLDVHHIWSNGERVEQAILAAGSDIGWFHSHGSKRVPPGAPEDATNWSAVAVALKSAGYSGRFVVEPFGAEIRQQIPELGIGLPGPYEPVAYFRQTSNTFREHGVIA